MQITKHFASEPVVDESNGFTPPDSCESAANPPQLATAADTIKNYRENPASICYNDGTEPNDTTGKYAFQRLRQPCFIPHFVPTFKLLRDDKFYAIDSCFARGIENALVPQIAIVESAGPEFTKLQPANRENSGPGFTNNYNTYSTLNELRSALDPNAEFSRDAVPAARSDEIFRFHEVCNITQGPGITSRALVARRRGSGGVSRPALKRLRLLSVSC